ncbi:hypothetical protein AHMF7605_11590 [Adhaeribacter arboris]|uniref:Uncharacterized protein n=1 Tax=Adhaeribacter arboris TaxID=2072846 RepID=A0A2T2YF36_9BACT|nr:hypothetical protein AHMF7605_11590 [Adhaeribacter arboris]
MDKGLRHQIKMRKYKKRLKQLNLQNTEGKFYAYRSHGAPCSCHICSHTKYKREKMDIELG